MKFENYFDKNYSETTWHPIERIGIVNTKFILKQWALNEVARIKKEINKTSIINQERIEILSSFKQLDILEGQLLVYKELAGIKEHKKEVKP